MEYDLAETPFGIENGSKSGYQLLEQRPVGRVGGRNIPPEASMHATAMLDVDRRRCERSPLREQVRHLERRDAV
jgi:hypothetical protein